MEEEEAKVEGRRGKLRGKKKRTQREEEANAEGRSGSRGKPSRVSS